jgi:hypothetical protein
MALDYFSDMGRKFTSTAIGRGFTAGAGDALGFYTPKMGGRVGSYLGINESLGEMGMKNRVGTTLRGAGRLARQGRFGAASRALYKQSARGFRALGTNIAFNAIPHMAAAVLGTMAVGVATGLATVGAAGYALGEAGIAHRKRLRATEFATTGAVDALSSVGAATNRQRAVMALNNTHLNGRMAMGNEGFLMHGDATTGLRGF